MGSRISAEQKLVIMTAEFLERKIIHMMASSQDLDVSELQKLVISGGLEYDVVFSLDLEHQSLVNIDDLWRFQLLTTLEMPNNLLERIEGLECLIHLQNLDLSFNFIKCISGLQNLVNLIKLNLTSNEISELENMESLKKLETFLIRHNRIKSFDNILYLAEFKCLSCLGIDKNPLIQDEDAKLHIIAVLPQLKFLDFDLITENQLKKALKRFPAEPKTGENSKEMCCESNEKKIKCSFIASDEVAYVDGLANGQGFQSLLSSDKNYSLLHSFPLASNISNEITEIFDAWHEVGHNYYEKIQLEKSEFLSMVSKAKSFALEVSREEELKFITFKENITKELCLIYQNNESDDERDKAVSDFKKTCEAFLLETLKNCMHSTCLCLDLISNMCKIHEREINLINARYVQEVEKFIKCIMDINETFSLQLENFYIDLHDSGFPETGKIETEIGNAFELNSGFLQLIQKKELITSALKLSNRIHASLLTERINNLKSALEHDLEETIDQVLEEAFVRQSEQTRHTVIFCNKQKYFIDKLFSKNNIFKHYLGYR